MTVHVGYARHFMEETGGELRRQSIDGNTQCYEWDNNNITWSCRGTGAAGGGYQDDNEAYIRRSVTCGIDGNEIFYENSISKDKDGGIGDTTLQLDR